MRNSGKAFKGATLGPMDTWAGWLNAVEITFNVTNARIAAQYRNIRAYQWSGPEAIWIQASSGDWKVYKSGPGAGEDLPEPENKQYKPARGGSPGIVAYWDSPGLTPGVVYKLRNQDVVGIYGAQNFTGWVVGDAPRGVPAERLSGVLSWYSSVCILKTDDWRRYPGACATGIGWISTSTPPFID
jgi:hypothetical protein